MKDKTHMVKPAHAVMPEDDGDDIAATLAPLKNSETVLEKNHRQEGEEAETGPEKMDEDMGK